MGFEGKLFSGVRELHDAVHNKPFIARYGQGKVTLLDHYHHLIQLFLIYKTIEKKINNQSFAFQVPEELAEISCRLDRISADLTYLRRHLPQHVKEFKIAKATEEYVAELNKLDESNPEDQKKLLAHFLVRILGDLSGGQAFKGYIRGLYDKERLPAQGGTTFYEFSVSMHKRCNQWLDSLSVGDEKLTDDMGLIIEASKEAFAAHINIFDELEATRPAIPPVRSCQGYGHFFVVGAVTALLAVGTAAVAYAADENVFGFGK